MSFISDIMSFSILLMMMLTLHINVYAIVDRKRNAVKVKNVGSHVFYHILHVNHCHDYIIKKTG